MNDHRPGPSHTIPRAWPAHRTSIANTIRTRLWAQSALGAIDQWPQSLKTVVDLLLDSPMPMVALWSSRFLQIFNDAYAELVDDRDGRTLGEPALQAQRPPSHFRADVLQATFQGQARSLPVRVADQGGDPRGDPRGDPGGDSGGDSGGDPDGWFDLAHTPLRDETGDFAGVLITWARRTEAPGDPGARHLQSIIDRLPVGVGTVDANSGRVLSMNPAALRMHGFASRADMLENLRDFNVFELRDADGHPLPFRDWPLSRALRGERVMDQIVRIQRRNGDTALLSYSANPAEPSNRSASEVATVIQDVTEHHEAERQMRQAFGLLEGITQGTQDLIAAQDTEFRYTFFNDAYRREFKRLWGTDIDVGASMLDALAPWPDEQAKARALWARALAGEAFQITEKFGRTPEEVQVYDLEFNPVRDAMGRQTGAAHILRNVTPRARMQEELQASEARLRESESFYRQAIESLPGMSFTCRPDGYCDYLSEQWAEYTGIPLDRLLGHSWPDALHADERDWVAEQFRNAVANVADYDVEYRILRRDGAAEWFKVRANHVLNPDGTVGRWVGTAVNIEHLKQAEAALQQADRRKDEFLATLAHELRNPLAPMQSGIEILRLSAPQSDIINRVLPMMERQMTQLVRMVEDLLDASRISRSKVELRREDVALTDVVRESVESIRVAANLGNRQIVLDLPDDDMRLNADHVRLTQIFTNLLSNAVKFTGDTGRIQVSGRRQDGHGVITVCDDGVGIDPDELQSVFELFTQARPGQTGGLGIGLTLARSLVRRHGGSIEARSEGADQGTEFIVTLPLEAPANVSAVHSASRADVPDRALRVLVVDDNEDSASSIAMMLKMRGHTVTCAYDGLSAVESVGTFTPDVVLMDLAMPGIDGLEAARRIRALPGGGTIRIIALTGWVRPTDRQETADAGFDEFLSKPVDPDLLYQTLTGS